MVKAILEGRKTQTRRIAKDQDYNNYSYFDSIGPSPFWLHNPSGAFCPYGKEGELLYVRETWWKRPFITEKMWNDGADTWKKIYYDADQSDIEREQLIDWGWKKKPSIHLPKNDSRIFLKITNIDLQELFKITAEDILAEGIPKTAIDDSLTLRMKMMMLWNKINKARGFGWETNPLVWKITFERWSK